MLQKCARDFRSAGKLMWEVKNWPQTIYAIILSRGQYPALRFRSGLTIEGLSHEPPFQWFGPIFRDHEYRRHVAEPASGKIVDIGANIGAATLDWLSRKPNVQVQAYEPDPATFEILARNVRTNGFEKRVRLYNQAVGGGLTTRQFFRVGASTATTAFPVDLAGRDGFVASVVNLDLVVDRCGENMPVALMKIDAEGAEAEILEGAQPSTLRKIQQVIIECHDRLVPGAQQRCAAVLQRNGFDYIIHPTVDQFSLLYAVRKSG
jgi:FkbM family methyltransferase